MRSGRGRTSASVLAIGMAGALGAAGLAGLAMAQGKPESLLPPGFDDPAPAPSPRQTQGARPAQAPTSQQGQPPAVQPGSAPGPGADVDPASLPPLPAISRDDLARLPSLEKLENMSTEELDQLLGLAPKSDIPAGAQRALTRVGVLAVDDGDGLHAGEAQWLVEGEDAVDGRAHGRRVGESGAFSRLSAKIEH